MLNLKFLYQSKLTKYFLRFTKFSTFASSTVNEHTIINLVYTSRLLPHKHLAQEFVKNYFLHVNGVCITNPFFQLHKYDILQLIIHIKYYVFYKYLLNVLHRDKNFIKKIFYYKNKPISQNKKKFSTLPDKLKSRYNPYNDVPAFLEVDFFTLSVYILYEPTFYRDLSINNHFLNRYSILRLYN